MMEQDQISLLKQMIVDKSKEQEAEKVLLMGQFHRAYESMRPINIVKGALGGIMATAGLKTTIVNGILGFVAGILVKKYSGAKIIGAIAERLV
jgi:hypothetical protein